MLATGAVSLKPRLTIQPGGLNRVGLIRSSLNSLYLRMKRAVTFSVLDAKAMMFLPSRRSIGLATVTRLRMCLSCP